MGQAVRIAGQDVRPCRPGRQRVLTWGMFLSETVRLEVGFAAAQARLANWVQGSSVSGASHKAYGDGLAVVRTGPAAGMLGLSKLVRVQFRYLVTRGDSALLVLRWEATSPGSSLFPVLDAHITLAADGDRAATLRLDGTYRPPLGALSARLDRDLLHRVAAATVASFMASVAGAIATPAAAPAPSPAKARPGAPSPGPEAA